MKVVCVFLAVGAIGIALPHPVQAQNARVSAQGHTYEVTTNSHGAVLTSRYPVVRLPEGLRLGFDGIEILYLGRDCDAYSDRFGAGSWEWANGGFSVIFADETIGFPRQDHPVELPSGCWSQ